MNANLKLFGIRVTPSELILGCAGLTLILAIIGNTFVLPRFNGQPTSYMAIEAIIMLLAFGSLVSLVVWVVTVWHDWTRDRKDRRREANSLANHVRKNY